MTVPFSRSATHVATFIQSLLQYKPNPALLVANEAYTKMLPYFIILFPLAKCKTVPKIWSIIHFLISLKSITDYNSMKAACPIFLITQVYQKIIPIK